MSDGATIVILDLDGVLVDLELDGQRQREQLGQLARRYEQSEAEFRPLLESIERVSGAIARRGDEAAAAAFVAEAWAIIDAEERRRAASARARPGVHRFLAAVGHLPMALFTNNSRAAVEIALRAAGIPASRFFAIEARDGTGSIKPSARPLLDIVAAAPEGAATRAFFLGDHRYDMLSVARAAAGAAAKGCQLLSIGVQRGDNLAALDDAGAMFVVDDLAEAELLISSERAEVALSIVLLAYNEEQTIERAVTDARRFGALYLADYEVLVVDDGSSDATRDLVQALCGRDVRLVVHRRNMGMGASMRDGYLAAAKDYVAHLPGDRQVRPQALLRFLPHVADDRVVVSSYEAAPANLLRSGMSRVFALLVRHLGGYRIHCAGTYVFHRRWLERVDGQLTRSSSFVYSFQLLEQLRRAGCRFDRVRVKPFARAAGQSRVATPRRIAGVFAELLVERARAEWLRHRRAAE